MPRERVEWGQALRRHRTDPSNPNHTFYFDLGDGTVIDGAVGGNSARWINHSCAPNCGAESLPRRIFIRATRAIAAGEELGLDYALVVQARHTRSLRLQYACHCGVPDCRGTMLAERRKPSAAAADSLDGHRHQSVTRAAVRILERPSPDVLIVSWREAGRRCYSEQRWQRMEIFVGGTCALSGETFSRGERVFRPVGHPPPANRNARISERAVDELFGSVESSGSVQFEQSSAS